MKSNRAYLAFFLFYTVSLQSTDTQSNNQKFWSFSEIVTMIYEYVSPTENAKSIIKEAFPPQQPSEPVVVQQTTSLCNDEKIFLQNRECNIQQILKTEFDIHKPLRIGFCCSGGGNRAMIGTLGCFLGAAKSKILDVTTYISGLSGSTWLIAPFSYLASTSHKNESFEKILSDLKEVYHCMLHDYSMIGINGIHAPPLLSFDSTDDFLLDIAKRFAYEQQITLVNLFGFLVGDYALCLAGNDRLSETWSTTISEVKQGNFPLPLCASIFEAGSKDQKTLYEWFEVSPLQAGSASLGYIPLAYLGSDFKYGELDSFNIKQEYPLSFYLGMFGSAFAATVHDIGEMLKEENRKFPLLRKGALEQISKRSILSENSALQNILSSLVYEALSERNPLTYAQFPNYSKGLESSILYNKQELGLFDAGIDFDLPLPLLIDRSERNLDLIILYDSNPGGSNNLEELRDYCMKKNVPFPSIDTIPPEVTAQQDMIILNDPRSDSYHKEIATYLYFPTNNIDVSEAPYITFNFKYYPAEIDWLSDKVENVFLGNIDQIKQIMQLVSEKRSL